MIVVEQSRGMVLSIAAKEISAQQARHISSPLAKKILQEISKKDSYPMAIAKALNVNEQKVYYHIRKLEKAGIIEVSKAGTVQGAKASYYALSKPAFVVRFGDFEQGRPVPSAGVPESSFLEPFVEGGRLNACIIVGSPDPHGPEKARSRDGYYAVDFGLFLGTYLNSIDSLNVKLDTEARAEDLQKNIILIGGPVINTVTSKINSRLPVRFDKASNWGIVSKISGKSYPADEAGIIVKAKNPFNPKKQVLVIAGKRHSGTKAAMIAFIKKFNEIALGNIYNHSIAAKVVEGVDIDSDGIVDSAEILE